MKQSGEALALADARLRDLIETLVSEEYQRANSVALYDADTLIVPWVASEQSSIARLPADHLLHSDEDFAHYLSHMGNYVIVGLFIKDMEPRRLSLLLFIHWIEDSPSDAAISWHRIQYHGRYAIDWESESFDLEQIKTDDEEDKE